MMVANPHFKMQIDKLGPTCNSTEIPNEAIRVKTKTYNVVKCFYHEKKKHWTASKDNNRDECWNHHLNTAT